MCLWFICIMPLYGFKLSLLNKVDCHQVSRLSALQTDFFYEVQLDIADQIQGSIAAYPVARWAVLALAGAVSAVTPCTLGMLPVTLAYLGEYDEGAARWDVAFRSLSYTIGVSAVYSILGVCASVLHQSIPVPGQLSGISSGVIYIAMGLSLLEIIQIRFPQIKLPTQNYGSDTVFAALALGASSALMEAPCTSPILAALLTYLTTQEVQPLTAAAAMSLFAAGYTAPVVMVSLAGRRALTASRSMLSGGATEWTRTAIAAALLAAGASSVASVLYH
jgi:cytochrome c-type biogenesis protein